MELHAYFNTAVALTSPESFKLPEELIKTSEKSVDCIYLNFLVRNESVHVIVIAFVNEAVTGFCGSGKYHDCPGGTSHGIQCCS